MYQPEEASRIKEISHFAQVAIDRTAVYYESNAQVYEQELARFPFRQAEFPTQVQTVLKFEAEKILKNCNGDAIQALVNTLGRFIQARLNIEQRSMLTNQSNLMTFKWTQTGKVPLNKYSIAKEFEIDPTDIHFFTMISNGAIFDVTVDAAVNFVNKPGISLPTIEDIAEIGVQNVSRSDVSFTRGGRFGNRSFGRESSFERDSSFGREKRTRRVSGFKHVDNRSHRESGFDNRSRRDGNKGGFGQSWFSNRSDNKDTRRFQKRDFDDDLD